MFEPLSDFYRYNNENNLFISTNITYFPKLFSCPDIPVKSLNESLTQSRLTSQEYAQLALKMKQACNGFVLLTFLWALRWMSRFALIYFLVFLFRGGASGIWTSLGSLLAVKVVLFILSAYVMESYRTKVHTVLSAENESTFKSRNMYWKVLSGCRYIHLVLNYSQFNCNDTVVTLNNSDLAL